ncbi:MAG: S-layer homology domain-containing protein [Syntrophomonadales bacterium]
MKRRILVFFQIALLLMMYVPAAMAATTSLSLNKSTAAAGDTVTASGTTSPGAWVPLKVLDGNGGIVVFDAGKAGNDGNYSVNFVVPQGASGPLTVVVGEGSNVATATLNGTPGTGGGTGGGGGGGVNNPPTSNPVTSSTGSASVAPSAGGTVGLGNDATIDIPANALTGTSAVEVKVAKVTTTPSAPTGFKLAGNVYEFTVDGKTSCSFSKKVAITLTFDPGKLAPGETPSIHYYDQAAGRWVNLGGVVKGNTVTVQVDHFTKFAVLAEVKSEVKPGDQSLRDIAGHWAEGSIKQLVTQGAVAGYADGTFKPENRITRAEFATILVKAFKLEPQKGKVFADTAGHWAQDSIATAAYYGIVNGYDANTFGPNNNITREQMAAMVMKAAQLNPATIGLSFKDSNSISGWAKTAVATAVDKGIINGYPDNTFRPQGNATRAEAVTVVVKAL